MWGKDTTQVSLPPTPVSTSRVWDKLLPWVLSVWCQSEESDIITPHFLQLTLVRFRSQNVAPSPFTCLFYASLPRPPQMKPGVQVVALIFPMFV